MALDDLIAAALGSIQNLGAAVESEHDQRLVAETKAADLQNQVAAVQGTLAAAMERVRVLETSVGDYEPLGPTDKVKDGHRYRLTGGPRNTVVDVPCEIIGGGDGVWSPNGYPALDLLSPCRVSGVFFDCPTPPASGDVKVPAGACVRLRGPGAIVQGCTTGRVNTFAFSDLGNVGGIIAGNRALQAPTSYFFYGQGGEDFYVVGNVNEFGSVVEQPMRCSPATTGPGNSVLVSVCRRGHFIANTVRNDDPATALKGCIDIRQMLGGTVAWNHVYSYPSGGAIAVGPVQGSSRALYDFETADDITIARNDIHGGGQIQTRMGRRNVVAFNSLYDIVPDSGVSLSVQLREQSPAGTRVVEGLYLIGNKVYLPNADTSRKELPRYYQGPAPAATVYPLGNVYLRQPTAPPVTVAGGLGGS